MQDLQRFILLICLLLPSMVLATHAGGDNGGDFWVDGPAKVQPGINRNIPDVSIDKFGRSIYVWYAFGSVGGDRSDVFLRRFDAAGEPLKDPVMVNTSTEDDQFFAREAVSEDGSFLVVWQSDEPDSEVNVDRKFVRSQALAADPSCDNPNLTGIISTDTSYSGEVFADQLITINNGATLTLEAGTHITMCSAGAEILVGNLGGQGGLVAIGTRLAPIVFDALDPAIKWKRIFFNSKLLPVTTLQHVVLNDGGGNDPAAFNAPLYIGDASPNDEATPIIDHVTINDSGAFGLVFLHNTGDPTTASVSNISIFGSGAAAITGDAGAMGGLSGKNQLLGNKPDRIIVGAGTNAQISIHSTWRNHGVPYELTGGVAVRTTTLCAWPCKWSLKPGVTLLVHPAQFVTVGSVSDATFEAIGTAEHPITITRLAANEDFWGQLTLSSFTNHKLEHVNISWGGKTTNPRDTFGMINQTGSGTVNMAHVRIENSQSSGYTIAGGDAFLRDVVVTGNPQLGLNLMVGGKGLSVRNSQITDNLNGGIFNAVQKTFCVDAIGNYWGGVGGPAVSNDLTSSCGNGDSNIGLGNSASRGVLYRPWLNSENGIATNRSIIEATPSYVIADGINVANVIVTLRGLDGKPLVGKTVEIQSTAGDIQQPLAASDSNGQVIAQITAPTEGFATISATNVTDNDQVAGVAGVTFWQGTGDFGGLIDPTGAPYATPELVINTPPFIVGVPIEFTLPMQNSLLVAQTVEVIYSVSNLNIGVPFSPVFTTRKTLQPGESWDAPGVYIPDNTRHQCVQAELTFDSGGLTVAPTATSTAFKFAEALRKNIDKDPCNSQSTDNLVPSSAGFGAVIKHLTNAIIEGLKIQACLKQSLSFSSSANASSASASLASIAEVPGDFNIVYTPPILTPPTVASGGEITVGLAKAMNELATLGAELSALITANGVTRQRLQWASQANDLSAVDLQYTAFRNYSLQEGQLKLAFAQAIDTGLTEAQMAGIADPLMIPEEQTAYLEMLKTTGFDQDTIDYLLVSGWSLEELDRRLQELITQFENRIFTATTFSDAMRAAAAKAIVDGNILISRYGGQSTVIASSQLASEKGAFNNGVINNVNTIIIEPMTWTFDVGHGSLSTETVTLKVKPLNLPINWSYELSDREFDLDPGEIREVKLRLIPGPDSISADTINIAVEGYILDALIGGIVFEYYTPNVIQPDAIIFSNSFE